MTMMMSSLSSHPSSLLLSCSDLKMAPLDTNDYVTAWIPLRPIQVCPEAKSKSVFHSTTQQRTHRSTLALV